MDNKTLAAYLDRIAVARPRVLDEAAFRILHRAHQMAVPFENLSIHLAEPISLDEDDLFGKIITRRRGGLLLRAQRRLRAPAAGPRRPGGAGRRARLRRWAAQPAVRPPRPGRAAGRWRRSLAGRRRLRQPQHLPAAL